MKITLRNRPETTRIMVVSSDPATSGFIIAELKSAHYEVSAENSIPASVEILRSKKIDLVLCDDMIDGRSGLELVRTVAQSSRATELIFLCDADSALAAIEGGATDTLTKPLAQPLLLAKTRQVVRQIEMKEELTRLRQHVAMAFGFDNMVGESDIIRVTKDTARRVAPTDIPLLLHGQAGTGRGQLARIIHHHSSRRHQSFETIDCATTPSAIIEEELFGNCTTEKVGILQKANGGTVYLANIDSLPPDSQTMLMPLFQLSEIVPIGSNQANKVNLRFICSISTNIEEIVSAGDFRKDLFNYISTISIELPPLSDRGEDIDMLAEYFLRKTAQETNTTTVDIDRDARERLHRYSWPGNIRELENLLSRAAALCRDNCISVEDLIFLGSTSDENQAAPTEKTGTDLRKTLLADNQRDTIMKALDDNNWNFTQTAQTLGIGRTTLWRKVKKYNLKEERRVHDESVPV